ncbi:MAG TPA: glycosyltransferase, partial [Chloroflexota bacterium]
MNVSVIIPTWNRAGFVGRAIQSALDQRPTPEVIVVDDESTDNTEEVVRRFDNVTYIRQENRREGAARNAGAARATGTYLAFLDSDDYWLPDKLVHDVQRFEQPDDPALVYSRALNVDEHDAVIGARTLPAPQGDVFWALAREAFMPMSSVVVRADAFR